MGGATISLKTTRNKNNFQNRPNFFSYLNHIYEPLIFANKRFSKIRSINSGSDGFMCQSWAKMSKNFP